MGILSRFKKRSDDVMTSDNIASDPVLKALLGGTSIDRELAMSIPAVSSAVDRISNTIACLPIKLYEEKTINNEKRIEEIKDDVRVSLLNDDTKDTLDGFQFKKAIVEDYLIGKGGYAFIKKERNIVKSLHYVEDEKISIMTNADPIFKSYNIQVNAKEYKPYEFIKILKNTKDGASSKSTIDKVSQALETAYQTMLFELNLVQKGGNKKGFLKSSKKLSEEAMDKLKSAWKRLYRNNEENVVILNEGLDFVESSNTSVEMQLNERKTTLKQEINDIFHISEDENKYIKNAILPIVEAFQIALNRDLLLEKEKKSFYFAFDLKELLKGTTKERYEAYKLANETGWITKNEIRYLEDYEAIDGLDVVSFNLGNVLYDVKTKQYYTPNTDSTKNFSKGGDENENGN